MPSVTNYVTKEHSVADTPSGNMGSAKDDHAPVGYSGSWLYREYMRFPSSGPPSGAKIVSCILSLKTTSGVHFQHGSGPRILIHRLTSDFAAEGGGTETWRTDADPVWGDPNPTATSVGEVDSSFGNADNYVRTFNITDIYEEICSAGYFKRDGTPAGGSTNHGIRLRANTETSSTNRVEFHSMRGSYVPRVEITWTVPKAATAPDCIAPLGSVVSAPTIFSFLFPSGDGAEEYELEVGTAVDTSNLWNPARAAVTPGTQKNVTYAGTAFSPGVTYHWRVRGFNEVGTASGWSRGTFIIAADPVVTNTTGALAEVWNLDTVASWASAEGKARLRATYNHPGGLASAAWEVRVGGVVAALAKTPAAVLPGGTVTLDLDVGWARNVSQNVEIRAQGSGGNWSPWTAAVATRINWAQGVYTFTHGLNATDFSVASVLSTDAVKTKAVFLYRQSPSGAWVTSPTAVPTGGTAMDMLIRLSSYDAAINPSLTSVKVNWSAAGTGGVLDHWGIDTGGAISSDTTKRRYGMHSAKVTQGAAANWFANNKYTTLQGGTEYTFSCYVNTGGVVANAYVRPGLLGTAALIEMAPPVGTPPHTGQDYGLAPTDNTVNDPDGWRRIWWVVTTPGSRDTLIDARIGIWIGGSANPLWFDGVQFEEGVVATGWKPGQSGPSVVVDVGGIAVDGKSGGVFRLIGSNQATDPRAVADLSANGLRFGGDTELWSPYPKVLQIDTAEFVAVGNKATPAGGQFRAMNSPAGIGFIIRNDGTRVYFLLTASGDPYGTFNSLRPFYIDTVTGLVGLKTSLVGGGGTSFPTGQTTGDRFWRTDRSLEYFWDGTRWLTTTLFVETLGQVRGTVAFPYVATTPAQVEINGFTPNDTYVEDLVATAQIVSGGSALSASHKWVTTINRLPSDTLYATINWDSGASGTVRQQIIAIGAVIPGGEMYLGQQHTKTGTPGNFWPTTKVRYRLVG